MPGKQFTKCLIQSWIPKILKQSSGAPDTRNVNSDAITGPPICDREIGKSFIFSNSSHLTFNMKTFLVEIIKFSFQQLNKLRNIYTGGIFGLFIYNVLFTLPKFLKNVNYLVKDSLFFGEFIICGPKWRNIIQWITRETCTGKCTNREVDKQVQCVGQKFSAFQLSWSFGLLWLTDFRTSKLNGPKKTRVSKSKKFH